MSVNSEIVTITPKMDEVVELKQLLIDHAIIGKQELDDLISSQSNTENQLEVIFKSIESRDRDDIKRFFDVVLQSALVTTDQLESTDSGLSRIKSPMKDLINKLEDMLVDGIHVIKATEARGPPNCYRMSRHRRGYCLIINNMEFVGLPYRKGSMVDELRLIKVFKQLGFEPKTYQNLSAKQITQTLKNLSKDKSLSEDEALVVIILSHGTDDEMICGSDDQRVGIESLLNHFNNINCPQLIGKPKIFFISACRGDLRDVGLDLRSNQIGYLSGTAQHLYSQTHMPRWSDFFVVYSTSKDYVSIRNMTTGSWLIYELTECLAVWAANTEFLTLMTQKVANRVGQRQSFLQQDSSNVIKQAIETRTLGSVKSLYFNPGLYEK